MKIQYVIADQQRDVYYPNDGWKENYTSWTDILDFAKTFYNLDDLEVFVNKNLQTDEFLKDEKLFRIITILK